MNIDTARQLHRRLTSRAAQDPTRSAAALRVVLEEHGPISDPDRPGEAMCAGAFYPGVERAVRDGRTCMDGTVDDRPAPYPCATTQTIALELRIPVPQDPTYGALIDG